jgi:hypothetical protein
MWRTPPAGPFAERRRKRWPRHNAEARGPAGARRLYRGVNRQAHPRDTARTARWLPVLRLTPGLPQPRESRGDSLPTQRGNVSLTRLQVLNAILYVAEQGCNGGAFQVGSAAGTRSIWRMNRWAKNGVLNAYLNNFNWNRLGASRLGHSRSTPLRETRPPFSGNPRNLTRRASPR